jgi:DNA helicase-2/ATP-dependent DNA helicase PcrA
MQISERDWVYEKQRLEKIYKIIEANIEVMDKYLESFKGKLIATNKMMWEDTAHFTDDFDRLVETKQYLDILKNFSEKREFFNRKKAQLEKLQKSPYFARVDFLEKDHREAEEVYIGISTLFHKDDILIYDWRAPICSIFYEYEIGNASYKCPDGIIEGEILLKRQFKIYKDKIEYMFNTDVKIDDDILQEILSKNVDNKMRTIVSTIQKEQNRVIRNEESPILVVQGPAGSGKTSVALHRAAYLLYRFRDTITAKNIIIFSPNKIFSSYISNVLPELGEENIKQTSFMDFAAKFFSSDMKLESFNSQLEKLLCFRDEKKAKEIQFKSGKEFVDLMDNYIDYLQNKKMQFPDIVYKGETIVNSEEISNLYNDSYKSYPYGERLKLIRQRLFTMLEKYNDRTIRELAQKLENDPEHVGLSSGEIRYMARTIVKNETEELKSKIIEFTRYRSIDLYKMLFENDEVFSKVSKGISLPSEIDYIRKSTVNRLNNNIVSYEDIAPVIYLEYFSQVVRKSHAIKHVIIDEAQDYSPIQYKVLFKCFEKSNITILGDLNQTIHPYYNVGTFGEITGEKEPPFIVNLDKSYRSTKEISDFSQNILFKEKVYEVVSRPGEKPILIKCEDKNELIDKIIAHVKDYEEKGIKSIAIVCKTYAECKEAYSMLKGRIDVNIVGNEDSEFPEGTIIIPSYLIKGLEYDAVLVYNANYENYYLGEDRKLFYTICTRALHHLRIYFVGEPFSYLKDIRKDFYSIEK